MPADLGSTLDLILNALTGAIQRPVRIFELNTPASSAGIAQLPLTCDHLADRKLAKQVRIFHGAVVAARISSEELKDVAGDDFTLSHNQHESVKTALAAGSDVRNRLSKLARKEEA